MQFNTNMYMAGLIHLFQILIVLNVISSNSLADGAPAKQGCPTRCGDVDIPYPFGIGENCSISKEFVLTCTKTDDGTYKPFVPSVQVYNTSFSLNEEVLNISLPQGQVRMKNRISWLCYNNTQQIIVEGRFLTYDFTATPFRFSNTQNKFTTIGAETLAYIYLNNGNNIRSYRLGCVSVCLSLEGLINGSCSGIGCCQTAIPPGMNYYIIYFDWKNYNNSDVYSFSPCSYAVLMEGKQFEFSTTYLTTSLFWDKNDGHVPMVMDWAIGNFTCKEAQRNKTSYACISYNSTCVDSINGPGYLCNCTNGYYGNPYLPGGCKDINECLDNSTCSPPATCVNIPGSYKCLCPRGTQENNSNGQCYKNGNISLWVKLVEGVTAGLMFVVILSCSVYFIHEQKKVAAIKEKYFEEYGGQLLYQEMKSKEGFTFTIFKEKELKEATNSFDAKNMLGEGGNGAVYKGTLENNIDVAIKRCKTIDERQKKEFGKEILILSQINHKNIVRILGCCLEVEIPILVCEFVPNGTLFDLLHSNSKHATRISLSIRLRIAQEAAEAFAYLHSWASPPIVHRDVKSSNILLGENFMAKVSDFGVSILVPADEDQFLTLIQGTRGYLDPEYMQIGQLTVKSDVYSFGVVLLELLTRKKAFYLDGGEERCLSAAFLAAMKENKLEEIWDDQILDEESMDVVNGVAALAKECLNMEGEKRPEMREIAASLDKLRKINHHPWVQDNWDEIEALISESSNNQSEMASYRSLEEKGMLTME